MVQYHPALDLCRSMEVTAASNMALIGLSVECVNVGVIFGIGVCDDSLLRDLFSGFIYRPTGERQTVGPHKLQPIHSVGVRFLYEAVTIEFGGFWMSRSKALHLPAGPIHLGHDDLMS